MRVTGLSWVDRGREPFAMSVVVALGAIGDGVLLVLLSELMVWFIGYSTSAF